MLKNSKLINLLQNLIKNYFLIFSFFKILLYKNLYIFKKINLENFVVGLGWNSKIDIDSSVLMLDRNYNEYDTVFFGNLKSKDGSVIHRG